MARHPASRNHIEALPVGVIFVGVRHASVPKYLALGYWIEFTQVYPVTELKPASLIPEHWSLDSASGQLTDCISEDLLGPVVVVPCV